MPSSSRYEMNEVRTQLKTGFYWLEDCQTKFNIIAINNDFPNSNAVVMVS